MSSAHKERKIAPDLIRIIAASAVIIMHITSIVYLDLSSIGYKWWLLNNMVGWCLKWSTPVFVMISGYFLLNSSSANNPKLFFRNRFSKLIIPYLFWSLFYFVLSHEGGYGLSSIVDFIDKLWRSSTYYHLYFINVILGLYLVTPFLKKYVLSKNLNIIVPSLLVCSVFYLVGYTFFGLPQTSNIFTWFMTYIGYYLAGYWIGKMVPPLKSLNFLLLSMFSLFVGALITRKTYFLFGNQEMQTVLVKHFSPTIIVASLSLFYSAIHIGNRHLTRLTNISKLSSLSLGVYFIHPFWVKILSENIFVKSLYYSYNELWLVCMIITCIPLSFLSAYIIKRTSILSRLV